LGAAKNKANQSQIIRAAFGVLCAVNCEKEFEKTKPIFAGMNWRNVLIERDL
jgi:hypothetical protein